MLWESHDFKWLWSIWPFWPSKWWSPMVSPWSQHHGLWALRIHEVASTHRKTIVVYVGLAWHDNFPTEPLLDCPVVFVLIPLQTQHSVTVQTLPAPADRFQFESCSLTLAVWCLPVFATPAKKNVSINKIQHKKKQNNNNWSKSLFQSAVPVPIPQNMDIQAGPPTKNANKARNTNYK